MLVMGLTGWYKPPQLLNLFWLVVPLQIGVLVRGLRRATATGLLVSLVLAAFLRKKA